MRSLAPLFAAAMLASVVSSPAAESPGYILSGTLCKTPLQVQAFIVASVKMGPDKALDLMNSNSLVCDRGVFHAQIVATIPPIQFTAGEIKGAIIAVKVDALIAPPVVFRVKPQVLYTALSVGSHHSVSPKERLDI